MAVETSLIAVTAQVDLDGFEVVASEPGISGRLQSTLEGRGGCGV
jgi:hypothetical protein